MDNEYPPMILADDFIDRENVAWRIEPGVPDPGNPLIAPQYPWDAGAVFSHGTVLKDPSDGLFKAWYLSTPLYSNDRQLTYAYSEDGRDWVRPELDVYPSDGYERTNILLGSRMGGQVTQVSVFIHPEAEPEHRFEMFCFRNPTYDRWRTPGYENPSGTIRGLPLQAGQDHHYYGLYRHFSGDGLHWTPVGEPLAGDRNTQEVLDDRPFLASDGLYVFQLRDGTYVIHDKVEIPSLPGGYVTYDIGRGLCRTIARRESSDGWQWTHTYENILTPDWRDPQDTQFMELMMNEYNDGYIGVATVYHTIEHTIDLQLAGSRDGHAWFRPARRPCLGLAPLGDVGGGMLWPMRGFVFDGEMAHLYYSGIRGLHGDTHRNEPNTGSFHGAFCRASWEIGRMWAAMHYAGTDERASLTTPPQDCYGKRLVLNAATLDGGKVEAELVDAEGKPIEGYGWEDCRPFAGDEKCAALTWREHETVDVRRASLRIALTDARLYGFDWR